MCLSQSVSDRIVSKLLNIDLVESLSFAWHGYQGTKQGGWSLLNRAIVESSGNHLTLTIGEAKNLHLYLKGGQYNERVEIVVPVLKKIRRQQVLDDFKVVPTYPVSSFYGDTFDMTKLAPPERFLNLQELCHANFTKPGTSLPKDKWRVLSFYNNNNHEYQTVPQELKLLCWKVVTEIYTRVSKATLYDKQFTMIIRELSTLVLLQSIGFVVDYGGNFVSRITEYARNRELSTIGAMFKVMAAVDRVLKEVELFVD